MATKKKSKAKANAKRRAPARASSPRPRPRRAAAPAVLGPRSAALAGFDPAMLARLARVLGTLDKWLALFKARLHVVCLHEGSGHDSDPRLSKGHRDVVAWKNHDVVPRTIKFGSDCPLVGFPAAGVTLSPGENSDPFQVRDSAPLDTFTYDIDPPYVVSGGGPGEPVIIVEG